MPTPKGGYFLANGERVPSVTTILDAWHPDGVEGLLSWANQLGRQSKSHIIERTKAADAGTLCHAAIEKWIRREPVTWPGPIAWRGDPNVVERARTSFSAFLRWADDSRLTITHTETPMVSERHRFGGTPNAAMFQGRRVLLDWKTSSAIHLDHLVQVGGGYRILWDENHPDDPVQGFTILRFDRDTGDYHTHSYGNIDEAARAFLLLRRLYEIAQNLRTRTK
ncbi:MAG TPA: hypothetical protein VJ770_29495 [Stellaceae bacterium]|nr:hypothetical protein [Stellaceae bacterium]